MRRIDEFIMFLSAVLLTLMTLTVIVSVIFRYLLGITFVGSDELITLFFIYSIFIGSTITYRRDEHIALDFLVTLASPQLQKFIKIGVVLVVMLVQVFLVKASLGWMQRIQGVVTDGLRLPMSVMIGVIPVSAVLIMIFGVEKIITISRQLLQQEEKQCR